MAKQQHKQKVMSSHSNRVKMLNDKEDARVEEMDETVTQVQLSRKMLTSHASILNVLGNPELDINIPERFTRAPSPLLRDPSFSISSWQDISSPNQPTSLVLSNTSDDDMAVIPPHSVMMFDTDEDALADSMDFDELQDDSRTFVMPQMSVSDGSDDLHSHQFVITILSSKLTLEITNFVDTLKQDLNYELIQINLYGLSNNRKVPKRNDFQIAKSNLIFLINDGSKDFLDFLARQTNSEIFPKLTIINMMTVNYFVNLFEIINIIKPYQIWKTSSLSNNSILVKCKKFIDLEFCQIEQLHNQISTVYSSLMVSSKKDYKSLERQFKSDLSQSNINIDPLQISLKFSNITMVYNIVKDLFAKSDRNEQSSRLWLVASFTLGIGLGVGIASGAATMLGCYFYQMFNPPKSISRPPVSVKKIDDWDYDSFLNLQIYHDFCDYLKLKSSDFKTFLNILLNYVTGGFEKFIGVLLSIF